jgi:hypothetical protein
MAVALLKFSERNELHAGYLTRQSAREASPAPECYYPVHEVQSFFGPAEESFEG